MYVNPSSEISQDEASLGSTEPSAANCTSPSKTLPYRTSDMAAAGFAVGSSTGGSSCMPTVIACPPGPPAQAPSSDRSDSRRRARQTAARILMRVPISSERAASAITFAESTMSSITTYSSG